MSKRFGRNQRRRAREAIATLEVDRDRWLTAYAMADGLSADLSKKLHRLEDELDEAKDIAGSMSHLFPVTNMQMNRPSPDHGERIFADIRGRLPSMLVVGSDEPPRMRGFRREPLALLVSRVREDIINHSVHVRVKFADNEVAYGITAAAWHTMTEAQRTARIKGEISLSLAKLLATTDLRGYR